ncbi:nuclear protein [Phlyctema vagabunda]|uniref:Nuclear protein n=1 Tax=Phlyctema vagabunda TaxID=108571 RepID=A0ABR4P775_9HELO
MAESKAPIASAVILPDEAPTSPRAKRRQSSASEATSKRPRLSSPPTTFESPRLSKDGGSSRGSSLNKEERKRGLRLFSGLLNTLSQTTSTGQQKKRLEIEKRQQEKAKQQKVEDEGRKVEKLAKLKEVRKSEQIKFDEQSMRIRHSNSLAMAHFLCTKTEPKLYYKPWELLPGDEERINSQIADAKAIAEREVADFRARHPPPATTTGEADDTATITNSTSKETVGEPLAETPSAPDVKDTTNIQAPASAEADKELSDIHNGEVVVEAEEDTVIY